MRQVEWIGLVDFADEPVSDGTRTDRRSLVTAGNRWPCSTPTRRCCPAKRAAKIESSRRHLEEVSHA